MSKYTTIDEIKKGNMQFNATSAKAFRATMCKWHDADFTLADKIMFKNEDVNNFKNMIKTNERDLERLANGEPGVIRDKHVIESEIADYKARIQKKSDELDEYRKAQAERYEGARALLNKELHKAYENYVLNGARDEYIVALANWFDANGIEPTIDGKETGVDLTDFVKAVGKKKNSARQKIKTGKHNGAVAYQTWRDTFIGEVCDVMVDASALPLHKFEYELKENRKKNA